MIDEPQHIILNTEPSLNSRATIVRRMSPIDLSSILSRSIKRPAGEKIVCSEMFDVYTASHL